VSNVDEDDKPGTHWVCVIKNNQKIIFFDSYGKSPRFFKREYWVNYFRSLKCTFNLHSQLQRQSYISRTCGVWCLVFLHAFYNRQNIMDTFSVKINELLNNEKMLQSVSFSIYPRMQDVYKKKCVRGKGQICKTYLETYTMYKI
jgi:hypothetical protein